MSENINDRVEVVLEKIRPYLQIDGGDVELVEVTKDNIVKVRLLGACNGCPLNLMTLRAGIERAVMNSISEVKRIESVA